jgi:hypothetical protein
MSDIKNNLKFNTINHVEISSYILWRLEQYKINFISKINIDNKILKSTIINKKSIEWKYSSLNRYPISNNLAYSLTMDTVNTITVLYKIKDIQKTDKEVIYNIAYLAVKPKDNHLLYNEILEKEHKNKFDISENLVFQNICPNGSMISKDGEYRSGVLDWNVIQIILNDNPHLNGIFQYLLEYFQDALRERKYILLLEYYFPNDKLKNIYLFETEILCSSKKIHFFCISWFRFYYSYIFGFISNHINEIYKSLLLKYKKEDTVFFKSLFKKFSIDSIEEFRYICSENIRGYHNKLQLHTKMKLGQKITPLNLLEAQNHFNIEYAPWKEFMIANKLSDLVINNISNGFSLTNSWFLIKNTEKGLFDNPSQSDRLAKSRIAIKIADILNQARIYTRQNINNIEGESFEIPELSSSLLGEQKTYITSWLSSEFKELYKKIQESIDHSKEYIIMSNVSLNVISEYLGKTIYDSIFFTKKSDYYRKLVSHPFSKKSHPYFRKYMFELCYNLYCMNAKFGIIHGDLHLNNITLNTIFYTKNLNIEIKDPKILFVLSHDEQYLFKHNFYDLCIIDFSRSIIHPDKYNLFKLDNIPDFYNIIHSQEHFSERQLTGLLGYLLSSKPEFNNLEVPLWNSILHHRDEFFKILTTLDLYNVTLKMREFIKNDPNLINTYKESIELITTLNKSADYYLSTVLNRLLEQGNYEDIQKMEWPLLTIIKDVFSSDNVINFSEKDYHEIVDVYNFDNEIKFSLSSYAKFPDILQQKKKIVDNKVMLVSKKEKKFRDFAIKRRKLYEEQTFKNFNVINIIMKRQYEKNF